MSKITYGDQSITLLGLTCSKCCMKSSQRYKKMQHNFIVNIHELEHDSSENSFRKVLGLEEIRILRETYYLIIPENSPSRRLSFGHTIVYPWGRTTGHAHPDLEEVYFYIQGRGEMQINDKRFPVKEGDAVYIPAGSYHVTYNTGIIPMRFVWATFRLCDATTISVSRVEFKDRFKS
ncbi:MAG: cupin domain-containing protein [Thermosphaera sp.]